MWCGPPAVAAAVGSMARQALASHALRQNHRTPPATESDMPEAPTRAPTRASTHARLITDLLPLARAAGAAIMQIYAQPFEVRGKADASPVTAADELAEAIILAGLARLTPDIPVVAEEAAAAGHVPQIGERFWLVDPLDGTREFVGRNGEFTVNIALIEHGRPVLGVVLAPALAAAPGGAPGGASGGAPGRMFAGVVGEGAFEDGPSGRLAIKVRDIPPAGLKVLASRSHGDEAALQAWLQAQRDAGQAIDAVASAGSSLKLCLLAAGQADAYPRFGRTMEWDIAAGHAVLAAAGGTVLRLDGSPFGYGKAGFENPHFVAWGDARRQAA